jgi:hypothetical protein
MPVRHIVLWTLNDPADAAAFKAELDSCQTLVDGILRFDVAIKPTKPGLEANVDVVLDSSFNTVDALQAYQVHPHHKGVSERLGKLRRTRHVIDFEVS